MSIIRRPLLTEKSALGMDRGLYVLEVAPKATKQSVSQLLKKLFDVDAKSVRIVNLPAKKVTFKRIKGEQVRRRKAYVQLAKGQKLPGFELPKDKDDKTTETKETK